MYDSPVYCAVYRNDGLLIHYNGTNTSTDIATFVAGDIISIAVDVDADEIWIAKNNVWQGASSPNPSTGTSGHDLTTAAGVSYTVILSDNDSPKLKLPVFLIIEFIIVGLDVGLITRVA